LDKKKINETGEKMKKIILTLTALMIFTWQGSSFATSSVDALIQKLEDKGILTDQDAAQLKGEISSKEQESQQTTFKSMLPDWLNTIKLTGDFRIRDQYQRIAVAKGTSSQKAGYNRVRVRARLQLEDQLNDKLKVIFGIATDGENSAGVGNPRSNNLTLGGNNNPSEDAFNKPEAVVNKAYVIYSPASYLTLMGGKMDNPIWEPLGPSNANLLWDPNITPEGGVIQLQKKINDYITPFSTNAIFVLADATPTVGSATAIKTDPYMFVTQDGIKGNLTEKAYYKTAVSYYSVNNPDRVVFGNRPSATNGGNNSNNTDSTNGTATQYTYGYNVVGGTAELGMNDPFGKMLPSPIYIPQAGVFGQYFQNQGAPHNNAAWQMGMYMGSSQLNGWGTWKINSVYKVLERDSWLDILPDADDYNGATDTAGWRTELDIGLAKNVWFVMSYYHINVYKYFPSLSQPGQTAYSGSAPENLYQMDFDFRF